MVESLVYFNVVYCLLGERSVSLRWFKLPVPLKKHLYSSTFGLVKRLILAKIAPPPPAPSPRHPKHTLKSILRHITATLIRKMINCTTEP